MGQTNQISSIFWLILGLAVIYGSHRLGLGTLTHPGPGFLPFWCGAILAGLSLLVFIQGRLAGRRGEPRTPGHRWEGVRWFKTVFVVLAMLVYALLFTYLGFILGTTLLLIFLFKAVEPEKWPMAVGGAILTSVVCFVVFGLWLDIQLPRGLIERILF
jgi:putative tricarboxylic transport membrane protein